MADSPLPQWFDGSSYTHKEAASIMKYGPIARITRSPRKAARAM